MYKHTVAYGIGNEYWRYMKENLDADLQFDYVADINYCDGELVNGIPVIGLNKLKILENTLIVVFPLNFEILMTVRNEFVNDELNIDVIHNDEFHNLKLQIVGRKLAVSIMDLGEKCTYFFIIRYHFGDAISLLSSLSAFKILHNNPESFGLGELKWWYSNKKVEKIVAITNNRLVDLCNLCNEIDDTIVLDDYELDAINYVIHNDTHGIYRNILPDASSFLWNKNPVFSGNMSSYPFSLFDLPLKNDLVCKYVSEYKLKINSYLSGKADEYINNRGIDINKTVAIFPYAKSTSMIEEKYWNSIVNIVKKSRMRVFTNVGPGEAALKGTEELSVDISLLLTLVAKGMRIIGVQSGIIDALRHVNLIPNRSFIIWGMSDPIEKLWAYDMGVLSCNDDVFIVTIDNITYFTFNNERIDDYFIKSILYRISIEFK